MRRKKNNRFIDFMLYILIGIALVGLIGVLAAYNDAPWMPHGDRANQLVAAVVGILFGIAYLRLAWQTRRLMRLLADKPQVQASMLRMAPPLSQWWTSLAISVLAFAVGLYSLWTFVGFGERGHAPLLLANMFGGIVLAVLGPAMLVKTFRTRRAGPVTASVVMFGLFFPAVLTVFGIIRVLSAFWRLAR